MEGETELNLATNIFGRLETALKCRLRALLRNPTVETWQSAFGIILDGNTQLTLWQAVLAVDSSFPRTGRTTDRAGKVLTEWERVPDRATLLRALWYATH